jgi:hypothetical protein
VDVAHAEGSYGSGLIWQRVTRIIVQRELDDGLETRRSDLLQLGDCRLPRSAQGLVNGADFVDAGKSLVIMDGMACVLKLEGRIAEGAASPACRDFRAVRALSTK